MSRVGISRRRLLVATGLLPLVGLGGMSACSTKPRACVDETALDADERRMRQRLNYVASSSHPEASCANCAFYRGAGDGECGSCELLGGAVNRGGFCDSWAVNA